MPGMISFIKVLKILPLEIRYLTYTSHLVGDKKSKFDTKELNELDKKDDSVPRGYLRCYYHHQVVLSGQLILLQL